MAVLDSNWLTHFELLLKNGWRDLLQTCHKCSLWCACQVLWLLCWSEIQHGRPGLWLVQEANNLILF